MSTPFHMIWFTTYASRNWDLPDNENYPWQGPRMFHEMAHILENRGKFDALVFADSDGIPTTYGGSNDAYVRFGLENAGKGDPLVMFSSLAANTRHLGLIPTMSTTFYSSGFLSQALGSLDHMSNGRAGWNIVTSIGSHNAQNYGLDDLPTGPERYDHGDELIATLENGWAEADPAADAESDALKLPKLPQGKPVYMQAGGSERGRDFAAQHAEVVIAHVNSVPAMKKFRDDLHARMEKMGRDPNTCKVFFTVKVVVADTREEAEARYERIKQRPALSFESGLVNFASRIGYDVSTLPLDEPLPADLEIWGSVGIMKQYTEGGRQMTLREIGEKEAIKESYLALGSPQEIADQLCAAMEEIGGDGFAVRDTLQPSNVLQVVDLLMPELRARGATRSEYHYPTFRENLLDPLFASRSPKSAPNAD